jgi:hypothetical protein
MICSQAVLLFNGSPGRLKHDRERTEEEEQREEENNNSVKFSILKFWLVFGMFVNLLESPKGN